MKRITVILALTFALVLGWAPAGLADETNTYLFEEFAISIAIPNDYVVFTQDSIDSSLAEQLYGVDAGALADSMEESGIYLLANKAPGSLYEI